MRRALLSLLMLVLLTGCARPEPVVPTVAILLSNEERMPKVEGLKAGLRELGYAEGRLRFVIYSAHGDRSRVPVLAREAVASDAAVLVGGGGIESLTLSRVPGRTQPVVMMGVASTVRSGLVASFIRPGGTVTGLDNQHAELSAKRLELLTLLLPDIRRVLLLYDPLVIPGQHALEVTAEAADRLGVAVEAFPATSVEQALAQLQQLEPGDFDACLLLPAFILESGAAELEAEFDRLRLPVMGPMDMEGEAGLLAAYGVSMWEMGYQSARFVDKLLRGEDPARIPVETPDNPELVVDLRVAEELRLELSPVGLAFARIIGEGDAP